MLIILQIVDIGSIITGVCSIKSIVNGIKKQLKRKPNYMKDQDIVMGFIELLRRDDVYYRGFKDNIAMAFQDSFNQKLPLESDLPIHEISNVAADNFLKLFIKP